MSSIDTDLYQFCPYVNNARTHSPEQINKLLASLRENLLLFPEVLIPLVYYR